MSSQAPLAALHQKGAHSSCTQGNEEETRQRPAMLGGGCLDTCLVSTCEGVVRIPWDEVVYPKLLHNPSDSLSSPEHPSEDSPAPDYLSPTTGGLGLGWASSSGEADSWSWDEEDDLPPDGGEAEIESALGRLRQDHLAANNSGDYVELLEPRGGPDGGADPKQRYLEMHGICKTKTLPLCRRSKAIRLRKGKAWGYGRGDTGARTGSLGRRDSNSSGGRTGSLGRRDSGRESGGPRRDWVSSRPPPRVIDLARERRPCPPCLQDSDDGGTDPVGPESRRPAVKERRPGVGKEREGAGSTLPWEESHKGRGSSSRRSSGIEDVSEVDPHTAGNQSDRVQGLHSDSVSEAGQPRAGDEASTQCASAGTQTPGTPAPPAPGARRPLTGGSETKPLRESPCNRESNSTSNETGDPKDQTGRRNQHRPPQAGTGEGHAGKPEERPCPRGREVKAGGFRAPRRKRKGKGKGKGRSGGRAHHKGRADSGPSKAQSKTSPGATTSEPAAKPSLSKDAQSEEARNKLEEDHVFTSGGEAEPESAGGGGGKLEDQSEGARAGTSPDHPTEAPSDQPAGAPPAKAPPLLRDLDVDLLQSGRFILTGTVDRLGRGLVITEGHAPEEAHRVGDIVQLLSCYYTITRPAAREKGLTVLVDSRLAPPSELCLAALKLLKYVLSVCVCAEVPAALGSVLILTKEEQESATPGILLDGIEVHSVRGTGVLQQYVDRQQLTKGLDGDFEHSHADWLTFRLSLEQLTERCESALSLLGDALQSMDTEPLPGCIKSVPLSVDKHKQLMSDVLADERLTELQRRGGAWLAGLANGSSGLAQRSPDCRAALAKTSSLYDGVDDALHRLVRVSNQRGHDLEALGRLATLVGKLDKCEKEIERVQEQLEEYKDPPLSLSRLSLRQQKFRSFRETAMDLHSETLVLLGEVESWSELDWPGLGAVLNRLPPIREKASQWCDVVSSSSPLSSPSSPLSSLPPIPPSRFQDARALAMELGGGALLELWAQTLERYQRTLAHFKTRVLQAERGQPAAAQGQEPGSGTAKTSRTLSSGASSLWELEGEPEAEWGSVGEGGLQSWGSLASLFRPQNCSTLKIGEEKKKEGAGAAAGGGKFLQNLLNPSKKSPTDAPLPPKPPRKRHPSFDLQALLAPRRAAATVTKPAETPLSSGSRASPLSWLGRRAVTDPILTAGMAAALPGWKETGGGPGGGGGGGGVLIRGVEVSSKEVADHTGLSRQHVLLGRTEREMGGERPAGTAQSKLYLQWCRLVSSERQYVALLKAVEENYLPLLDGTDAPASLRGKAEALFSNWTGLAAFHSQLLLPAMEGALSQTLQQTDCFNKLRDQFLQYSHYLRMKPELDSLLVSQAADFFKVSSMIHLFECGAVSTVRVWKGQRVFGNECNELEALWGFLAVYGHCCCGSAGGVH
ncbi:hypothetical protein NFI96_008042 [Prochilodus magdalenae]|nr:hypothetical protein NFI96_008042 [Prochilodus magdalenae]